MLGTCWVHVGGLVPLYPGDPSHPIIIIIIIRDANIILYVTDFLKNSHVFYLTIPSVSQLYNSTGEYNMYIQAFYCELKQVLHIMEPGCGLATPC